MNYQRTEIAQEEITRQIDLCHTIFDRITADGARPLERGRSAGEGGGL